MTQNLVTHKDNGQQLIVMELRMSKIGKQYCRRLFLPSLKRPVLIGLLFCPFILYTVLDSSVPQTIIKTFTLDKLGSDVVPPVEPFFAKFVQDSEDSNVTHQHHHQRDMDGQGMILSLKKLSIDFQAELAALHNYSRCSDVTEALYCRLLPSEAGFGCHLDHRVACLMLAYALKLPLIYEETSDWAFDETWGAYIKPFGLQCSIQDIPNVTYWDWLKYAEPKSQKANGMKGIQLPKVPFLEVGFPVRKELAAKVAAAHSNPFLWFVGQFTKAIFQLRNETVGKIEKFKETLGILNKIKSEAVIGMHVRRTDKFGETKDVIPLWRFIRAAKKFRQKFKWDNETRNESMTIFVASDDCDVLPSLRSRWGYSSSKWRFVGSPCTKTLRRPDERRDQLFAIIRDISVLADCSHLICTFSSNVCTAVAGIRSFRQENGSDPLKHIKPLDFDYALQLYYILEAFGSKVTPV